MLNNFVHLHRADNISACKRRNDLPQLGKMPGTAQHKPKKKEDVVIWIYLILAGLLEVVWAYYMKQSAGFTKLVPTLITLVSMLASFSLLSFAMRTLPLGSAYTIWTGIGAIGAFILGIVFMGETFSYTRLFAALLILAGIVLMKLSSNH